LLCLWCALVAAGAHVGFHVVLLTYVAAVAASWVPFLPGGIGVVDAAVPAVLHAFGVPVAAALAGTLVWRGLSLFLPASAGVVAGIVLRLEWIGRPAIAPVAPIAPGVVSVLGVNDVVTIPRKRRADWDPVVDAAPGAARALR